MHDRDVERGGAYGRMRDDVVRVPVLVEEESKCACCCRWSCELLCLLFCIMLVRLAFRRRCC